MIENFGQKQDAKEETMPFPKRAENGLPPYSYAFISIPKLLTEIDILRGSDLKNSVIKMIPLIYLILINLRTCLFDNLN